MKNFTKQNFKTNPLWIRLLIMAFMLLIGTSSAWAQTWCLAGSFNGWSDAEFSNNKYSVTISNVGEYTFKIKKKGTWDGALSADGARMERNNCSNWTLYTNKGDSKFYADTKGEYIFTFNPSGNKLSITYPSLCSSCCTDYYIAGISNWNANADKMSCDNNVWSKKFTNVNNGTYYFQITNGTWDVKKGDYDNTKGNITLSNVDDGYGAKKIKLTTTSKGDITISFDGSKAWVTFEKSCITTSFSWTTEPVDMNYGETKDIVATLDPDMAGSVAYTASPANIVTINNNNTYTAVGKGDVTITATASLNGDYCPVSDLTKSIKVTCPTPAAPNVTETTNVVKCGDNNVTTNGTITIDNYENTSTYKLQLGNNAAQEVTPTNGVFSVSANGTYKLTVTNSCGSSSTKSDISVGLTQNQVSISDITGPDNICSGNSADYSITAIDGVTYNWSINSDKFTLGTNGSNSVSVTANGTTTTSATLTIEATKSGCPTPKTKTINIVPLPTISTVSPREGTVCSGTTISALEGTLSIDNSANSTTKWYKDEDEKSSLDIVEQGQYTIKAVSNTASCVSNSSVTYTVTGITTIPTELTIDINGKTSASICGGTATINAKATGATSYSLYKGNGDLVETKDGNANGVSFTVSETNTYKFKATNSCGTTANFSDAVQLTVLSTPKAPSFTASSEVTCSDVTVSPTLSPALAQGNYLVWYDAATGGNKIGTDGKTLTSGANNSATTYYAAVSNGSCESTARTPYTVYVESTDITNLRLYLVDDQGNELPDNHVYCQGETVKFKLSYNGGKYTDYSWSQTVVANSLISGSTSLDKGNNTGAGSFTLAGVQSSGTIAITLTSCSGVQPITSNALQVTVAPVPTISIKIRDLNVSTLTVMCHELVTLYATTSNTVDGALVYWYKDGVQIIDNGQPVTGDSYTFTSTTATTFSNISAKVQNGTSCPAVESNKVSVKFEAHAECPPSYKQGKIVYFKPNSRWKEAGARFAAYFYVSDNNNKWIDMLDMDKDGVYACAIPDGYSKVIFCRMDPNNSTNGWGSKWAQTDNLTIPDDSKRLYSFENIKADNDWYPKDGKWSRLDAQKDFRTIALTPSSAWDKDGATFWAHAWSTADQTMGFSSMVPSTEKGVYLVDIRTDYTDIVFERHQANGAGKHKTTDLKLDIYGNNYVITEAYHGGDDTKANGEWHWKWYNSTYELGVATDVVEQNGDNLQIYCSAVVYKTSCAPGIKYGFEYATNENMTNPTYVEYAQGYVKVGSSYEKWIAVEPGEYYVRAVVQFEDKTPVTGWVKKVVIANNCDSNYEFTVGSTSAIVQACGGSRELPAIEILTNKNVGGGTITWMYEWRNADGTEITDGSITCTSCATPIFNSTASKNYKVRVIKKVGGVIKCTQTTEYQVAYEDNSPKAVIIAPDKVNLYEKLTLQGEAYNTESFTWTVTENGKYITSLMLSDANVLNPTFNTKEAGTYTVTLTVAESSSCKGKSDTKTITVAAEEEDCASGDIEVKLVTNTDCFNVNGGEDLYISQDGTTWTYVTKISGGGSYTILSGYLTEKGITLPAKIMFGALTEYNCNNKVNARAYTITDITNDDKGKFITYTLGSTYDNTTSVIANGTTYKNKFTIASNTKQAISNTVSAPVVINPISTVNGTDEKAILSAYLEATGCSPITKYGFQYIYSEEEPNESDWSSTDVKKIEYTTTPTIGKTFTGNTEINGDLEQGKYWFRAFATNEANKTCYTEVRSFDIITDGPYPIFDDENNMAISLNADNKVVVKIKNNGTQPVLKGSYQLTIKDQNLSMLFTPLIVNTPINVGETVTFTTTQSVTNINHYNITATLTYKGRKDSRNLKMCTPIKAAQDLDLDGKRDTIYYTIDANAVTDKCLLIFPTVNEAVTHLRDSHKAEDADYRYAVKKGNGYILQQPVVMQVAYSSRRYLGNVTVNTTGGGDKANALIIPIININNDDDNGNCMGGAKYNVDEGNSNDVKYYSLTIRALNENAIPALQHIAIRDSRYITLQNLNIVSSDDTKDNAIDIDCNNNSWVSNAIGKFKNSYITVKGCNIESKGFTCAHVSAVDKVYFIDNEITADLVDNDIQDDNVRCWGSSVKFIRATNLLFLRNNFMGTHATSIWLQGVEGALFMNNVLWNNNKIETDIFAMFRIVQQTSPEKPKNIGIYYNTLYLADNSAKRSKHPRFNFLTLNSNDNSDKDDAISHNGDFDTGSIEFMYNNCYSYDEKTPGRPIGPDSQNAGPFKGRTAWAGLCYNNFWSAIGAEFSFNGCGASNVYNVSVKDNVCKTTASNPNSLVISGGGLDLGVQPTTDLAKSLQANYIYSDRTRPDIRPRDDKKWTLGAYQKTDAIATDSIIWQGTVSSDWDDRNNWIDANTKNPLSCVNTLATNLKVIIPAPFSENYPTPSERGIENYPKIPQFGSRNTEKYGVEIVNAGQGLGGDITLFADSIGMEYGASLRGVENLAGHYVETGTNFTVGRDQWTLVGTVVKPFTDPDNPTSETRNLKSGDYFIEKQTPHVYMHEAKLEGNTAKWDQEFTSKEIPVPHNQVFAIILPNEYGKYKLPSSSYYAFFEKDATKLNDNVVPKNYEFVGRFVNESGLPKYENLSKNTAYLFNNSYPCNIDPKKLEAEGDGTVLMYDYIGGSFSLTKDDDALIKPQHGFIFTTTSSGTKYEVTEDMLVGGDTRSRASVVEMPIFSLNLLNANSTNGEYSRVIVKYDELCDNGPIDLDIKKIFAENTNTPELYIVMYDDAYQRVHINNTEIIIPLGIRLMKSMNVSFQKFKAEGFDKVTLVDKVLNKEYDLLNTREVITEELEAGTIEGRFFLNLSESTKEDTEEGDDNVSTEIDENTAKSINILVASSNSVRVITDGVELETITVSDMAGRTTTYQVGGCFAEIELPVVQGVYMINVIGDTASRTEKVILK